MARTPNVRAAEVPSAHGEQADGGAGSSHTDATRLTGQAIGQFLSEPGTGRIWKFLLVGAFGLGVYALAFALAQWAGASPGLAWIIGAETAILSNFALNSLLTFKDRTPFKSPRRAISAVLGYHLSTAVGMVVSALLFWLGIRFTDIEPLVLAMLSATGALVNYALVGHLAFRKQQPST